MKKIWLCAIAKMEELYVGEWVEWHKKLGVDHIVIVDNNDIDYEIKLCDVINNYIQEGFVEIIDEQGKTLIQKKTYSYVYNKYEKEFDWIGFFDIDEFLELPGYNNDVHNFLSNAKKRTTAVILPWLCFGDNEQVYYENKPVKDRFTGWVYCEVANTKYFLKSLKNYAIPIKEIRSCHNPFANTFGFDCTDSLFNRVQKDFFITTPIRKFGIHIYSKDEYFENAYISHYMTKSTEEYIKYKINRGRISNKNRKYDKNYYYSINTVTVDKERLFNDYGICE